jgi:GntR family transcriptional regulator, transcriptional repressor for pyruvate dehydrogenase complex
MSAAQASETHSLPSIRHEVPAPTKASFLLAEHILRDIVADNLKPGDALPPEREMLEKYGMGRGTVREALRLLEYQGAIKIRQGLNGGPIVRQPSSTHFASTIAFLMQMQQTPFRAIVEVRAAIEPMIGELAAQRINQDALDELKRTIVEMREIIKQEAKAPSARLNEQFNDLNNRFHNVVAWASGNPLFQHLADSLHGLMEGATVGMTYNQRSHRGVVADHEAILNALETRNPAATREAMSSHLNEWKEYVSKNFPSALDQVIPWSSSRG